MDVVAVDWSGEARGGSARTWLAQVVDGELVGLRNGRSRTELTEHLVSLRSQCPGGMVVGLDFAFSFPAWFVRALGCATVDDVWVAAAQQGERWLADCAPPFWGRPGRPKPDLPGHFRRAEQLISVGGISPKSVFQIGGAGAVGTGSIRGMPHLPRLRAAGFAIWPFDPTSPWMVTEIYPRLLTGPVRKRDREERASYLRRAPWPIAPPFASSIIDSEDAFDAAVSAMVMHEHLADLATLSEATDPVTLAEGDIWRPPKITP